MAAGSKCPVCLSIGEQVCKSCHGAARKGRTGEEPRSGEVTVTSQGCKGELAHPGAFDASRKPP